ncbi:MAG: hypothetical protein GXY17_04905 [Clostridiaceae bacterium]|jgi:hypothetical protein|nr:hypothetical protein [Clostridiaceae bacterium]
MEAGSLKTKKIALNGILGALCVMCLVLATVLPTNRISLYALSSFFVAVTIIESGVRASWIFYVGTSILGLIIMPNKLGIVPYALFFGAYGIAKYYIEKLDKIMIEYIIKLVYFNICLGIAALTIRELFGYSLPVKLPWWLVIVILELVFMVYDFVYSLFINYYRRRIKPKLNWRK